MFKNASHAPSFKVIVSCYKSSFSILYFFELILKAYMRVVPNRIHIFQIWTHQSFICCPFYLLWTSVKISSQEAKGPISLGANVTDVCIPSQSFVIVVPRYLIRSTFSRTVPFRGYEAWVFLIRFIVICIILHLQGWNFKPHFLAQHPNNYWTISFWKFNVSSVSLISRQQTQPSAKSLISESKPVEMSLMCKENNEEPRTVPSGTPDKTGANSDFAPFTTTRCCLSTENQGSVGWI